MNPPITFKRVLACNRNRLLICVLGLSVLAVGTFSVSSEATHTVVAQLEGNTHQPQVDKNFGAVPLAFEMNQGQTDKRVRFIARGRGYGLFLTPDEVVIALRPDQNSSTTNGEVEVDAPGNREIVRMRLVGARKPSRIEGLDKLPGVSNYFIGNDPKKWRTNVPTFARVKQHQVYKGIDLIYHGNQHQLEYDFVVGPRVSPNIIELSFGECQQSIDAAGNLILKTRRSEIRQSPPIAYQWVNGQRREVQARYRLRGKSVGFDVGVYDNKLPLVIDPFFIYSTFLGGTGFEEGRGIAVDAQGNAYLTGSTVSTDFPLTSPIQPTIDTVSDAFVTKLNSSGTGLVYSTYLGGNGSDVGNAIAVDALGNAYVVGLTGSGSFPSTPGTIQTSKDGVTDGFITKIDPTGSSLVYSTFLGGNFSDTALDVAVDSAGNAYVVGQTDSSQSLVFPPLFFSSHGKPLSKSVDSAATWTPSADGLTASITTAFAQDPVTPANMYAGTNRGVYRSTDSGAHWQAVGTSPAPITGNAIVVDPSNPSIVYVGGNNGVFKSTNAGITFTTNNTGLTIPLIHSLAIDPSTPSTLYAGTQLGIFKSINGGDSWTEVKNGITGSSPRVNEIVIDPTNPNTIYIGTANRGLFKTTNAGGLWTPINTGALNNLNANVTGLVIDPVSTGTLYAAATQGQTFNVLFKTADGGASWAVSDNGLTFNTVDGPFKASPNALAIDPTTSSTVYAATNIGGVYKTTDGGATWAQANTGLTNFSATMIAVDRVTASTIYTGLNIGTDGFVVKLDPSASNLLHSATIGGDDFDVVVGVALDANGVVYIAGNTASSDFPLVNALDSTLNGFRDAFVMKFSIPSTFHYSTLLGGNRSDNATGIVVRDENAYVVGTTASSDFPLANPIKSTLAQFDTDAFVTKINSAGTALDFSTYLGGSNIDQGFAIAVDGSGVYVTGRTFSSDFPTLDPPQNSIGGSTDAFVTKLNSTGFSLVYSTYLGGFASDAGNGIAVDTSGNAYVCGNTSSANFPTVNPFQNTLRNIDAFVTKIGESMDLSLSMTDSPDPVALGSNLTYNITVSNVGTLPATGITLTDQLPAGATFVSATSGQGSCTGTSTITCNLGTLNGGAQTTVTIVIKPPAVTSISNTASVTANETDPTPANNTATEGTQVSFADFSVTATTAYGNVAPGAKVNYLLKVTNLTGSAAPVTLTDNLPLDTTFVSCAATLGTCGGSGNARTVTISSLAVGQSSSVIIVASLNQSVSESAVVTNTITVNSSSPDTDLTNNSASVGVIATATPLLRKQNGKIAFSFDQIFTVKSDASELPIPISGISGLFPRWSPDGSRLAYGITKPSQVGRSSINVVNANGSGLVTVADNALELVFFNHSRFTWSPGGSRIAYVGDDNFIYLADAAGLGSVRLPNAPVGARDLDWSPDGSRLVFSKDGEIFTVDVDGSNLVKLVSVSAGSNITYSNPLWSPDMTKIMLVQNTSSCCEAVFVVNSDGTNLRKLINVPRGFGPAWSPDGTKVSFINGTDVHVIGFDGSNELKLATSNTESLIHSTTWQPVPTTTPLIPPPNSDPEVVKISGTLTPPGGLIKVSGHRGATITDAAGHFEFVNLPKGGTYTVTPVSFFGSFSPASRTIPNLQQDVTGFDFVFTQQNHAVDGLATDPNGNPVPGRTISLVRFSSRRDTTTDQQGRYIFDNVFPGDSYLLLANCDGGFKVLPPFFGHYTTNLVCDTSNSLRAISGRIVDAQGGPFSLSGLSVTLDGGKKAVVKTDLNGNLGFPNLPAGLSYTVTPSTAEGFTFTSPQVTFNNLTTDQFVQFTATTAQPVVGFSSLSKTVAEGEHVVQLLVNRTGNTSTAGSVDYETADATASERTDYVASFGTLHFAPGETSKTLKVLITDDVLIEGDRSFTVTLTSSSGVTVSPNGARTTVIIVDDDVTQSPINPINDSRTFVRQHYADFLNREPDPSGLDFWTNEIESCGTDTQCREVKRINVSAAFFLSIEFQDTGFLVYRMHDVAFGTGQRLKLKAFLHDTLEIGRDVIVGQPGWEQQLEGNKQAFAKSFGLTEQFFAFYPVSMSNGQFVDMLNSNAAGVLGMSERNALVNSLNDNTITRGEVVRTIAENVTYRDAQFNKAFVLMQYFGYLRRAPNDAPDGNFDGWVFWLNKLNQFNGNFVQAEMVKAFISSSEYRRRFGP